MCVKKFPSNFKESVGVFSLSRGRKWQCPNSEHNISSLIDKINPFLRREGEENFQKDGFRGESEDLQV